MLRIEADRARFREIVRGKIRGDLKRYLSTSELFTRRGERAVSVPIPQIELPRLRFGDNRKSGVGQGAGERGDALDPEGGESAAGAPGEAGAEHALEVEVELEELAAMLGRELELPFIQPRGQRSLLCEGGRYDHIRSRGPDSLRHWRRTFRRALERSVASGQWDPARPRIVPLREDYRFRADRPRPVPHSSAVILHMMDVSGSMGREQKEIVRIQAFWIDTWLRSQYDQIEVLYIVHDAAAKIVDRESFFHLRESGGTKISSAYELCLAQIQTRYRPEDWNIYAFHYSDGDNWSARDTERCMALLRDELLPRVNQFCYGQVKSAYGSGQFKKDLDQHLADLDRLVTVAVNDRSDIAASIRAFLGKGR
ncbi:MAG: DUF444 family protein [Planctomycetes bacterium]|jgi:uncharacterized sporulation protein YeaH/YhbH (DUF444 family)|nr:DUF444 family protein [Planctomycetota bacterium]